MPALHTSNGEESRSNQSDRSTRKESKERRDLINAEMNNLRNFLPFPTNTVNQQIIASVQADFLLQNSLQDFQRCLDGCLVVCKSDGQLLYVGENAAHVLGYDLEDLVSLGDNLKDILETKDRKNLQQRLKMENLNLSKINPSGHIDKQMFLARVVAQKSIKKDGRPVQQKVILLEGSFVPYPKKTTSHQSVEPHFDQRWLFLGVCQEVLSSHNQHLLLGQSTRFYSTLHKMDMTITATTISVSKMLNMAFDGNDVIGKSWYHLIHWEDIQAARKLHSQICQTDNAGNGLALLRLQSKCGWQWCHVYLCILSLQSSSLQQSTDCKQRPRDRDMTSQRTSPSPLTLLPPNRQILATYQILTGQEARLFQTTSWLYDESRPSVTKKEEISHLPIKSQELPFSGPQKLHLDLTDKYQSINQSIAGKRKLNGKSEGPSLRQPHDFDMANKGGELEGVPPTKIYSRWRKGQAEDENTMVTVPTALAVCRSASSPSDEEQHVPDHMLSADLIEVNHWPVHTDIKHCNDLYQSSYI